MIPRPGQHPSTVVLRGEIVLKGGMRELFEKYRPPVARYETLYRRFRLGRCFFDSTSDWQQKPKPLRIKRTKGGAQHFLSLKFGQPEHRWIDGQWIS